MAKFEVTQEFASESKAGRLLGVAAQTLARKRRAGIFIEGVHYFNPPGSIGPVWSLEALREWVTAGAPTTKDPHENLTQILSTVDRP